MFQLFEPAWLVCAFSKWKPNQKYRLCEAHIWFLLRPGHRGADLVLVTFNASLLWSSAAIQLSICLSHFRDLIAVLFSNAFHIGPYFIYAITLFKTLSLHTSKNVSFCE